MTTCTQCGNAIPDQAAFCPACGQAVAQHGWGLPADADRPAAPATGGSDARTWAMATHLTALAGGFTAGLASFVGPLVIWLIKREDDPFVAEHAREALNFNLLLLAVLTVGSLVGALLGALTLGLALVVLVPLGAVLAAVIGLVWLIVTIQATLAASRGERYRYPFNVRFVR